MNLEQTIKLLIVEDYDALSLGIISHLKRQSQGIDYKVTQINNLTEALLEARMRCFDVILLDFYLNNSTGGGDLFLKARSEFACKPKIIIFSRVDKMDIVDHLVHQLEADGFILKSSNSLDEIVPAIAATLRGERYFSPTISEKLKRFSTNKDIDYIDRLLLKGLSKGMKQNEIADYLIENGISLTPSAIEKRVKRLKEHFKAKTSLELMSIVSKHGYI